MIIVIIVIIIILIIRIMVIEIIVILLVLIRIAVDDPEIGLCVVQGNRVKNPVGVHGKGC